jgi:hypothetical protein
MSDYLKYVTNIIFTNKSQIVIIIHYSIFINMK